MARAIGREAAGISPSLRCLTLLGTAGLEPEWNDPAASLAHRALPLLSDEMVRSMPMVHQLFRQLGVEMEELLEPDPAFFSDENQQAFNVFYVPEARDSPHIPAQDDFVRPYGIRSVLGSAGGCRRTSSSSSSCSPGCPSPRARPSSSAPSPSA